MKVWLALVFTVTLSIGMLNEAIANPGYYHHHRPHYCGYPGFFPGHYGYGGFAGGVYGFSATSFYSAAYAPLPAYGPPPYGGGFGYGQFHGGWGAPAAGWGYPGFGYGSRMGYQFNYYTHSPGMGLDYYRGPVPRYYPGPFGAPPFDPLNDYGAFGDYGYGPLGW